MFPYHHLIECALCLQDLHRRLGNLNIFLGRDLQGSVSWERDDTYQDKSSAIVHIIDIMVRTFVTLWDRNSSTAKLSSSEM